MTEPVQRFRHGCGAVTRQMIAEPEGAWVRYSDYEHLQSRLAATPPDTPVVAREVGGHLQLLRMCLQQFEFTYGQRKRGWDAKYLMDRLRAATEHPTAPLEARESVRAAAEAVGEYLQAPPSMWNTIERLITQRLGNPAVAAKSAVEELERDYLLADATPEELNEVAAIITKHFAAVPVGQDRIVLLQTALSRIAEVATAGERSTSGDAAERFKWIRERAALPVLETAESDDIPICLLCRHFDNTNGGELCQTDVPICSDGYHGTRPCGCKCRFDTAVPIRSVKTQTLAPIATGDDAKAGESK